MPATHSISDTTTRGVRVGATAFYLPEHSNPNERRFVFGYRIVIMNEGEETVQLLTRHWIIIDGDGNREEVHGEGVVGHSPVLKPGHAVTYTSYCPLPTPWGTMEGHYEMRTEDGERFEARIGRFILSKPRSIVTAPLDVNGTEATDEAGD